MDMKKINDLLNDKFDDDDLNEDDLENELEAILSGKPSKVVLKPAAPTRAERTSRAAARRAPPPPKTSRNVGSGNNSLPVNAPMMDISQMLKSFDMDTINMDSLQDNDDDDHNLAALESELIHIVNDGSHQVTKSPSSATSSQRTVTTELSAQSDNEAAFVPKQCNLPRTDDGGSAPTAIPVAPSVPQRSVMPHSQEVRQPIQPISSATTTDNKAQIAQIKQLQIEYKRAALRAKNDNDKESALAHFKVSKQLDAMMNSLNANEEVDLSTLPPMPQYFGKSASAFTAPTASTSAPSATQSAEANEITEVSQEEASQMFNAPTSASSILEALEQRLAKFKSTLQEATEQQNSSKARRLGRIVKQMETAIKDHKAGKPVDYDLLPFPPGFPPIPMPSKSEPPSEANKSSAAALAPQPKPQAAPSQQPANGPPKVSTKPQQLSTNKPVPSQKPPLKRGISTTGSKQLKFLIERQRLFREAALEAKKRNEVEQAKEYLRHAKGFDPLIEATKNGLPIDATSIPTPPQLNNDDGFVVIDAENLPSISGSKSNATFYTDIEREELFRQIEKELIDQIEMCNRNREYFIKMGDISTSSKFEKYASEGSKDLNMLRVRWRNGDNIPSYRSETRTFSIVVSNHDVGVNELQVDVLKAFDLPGKPEIDTYVRIEFPVPSENPQKKKTKTVYNTINPEFNESIKFEIDRKSRSLARILKRHPIKLEVFAKGGLFRSDACLGTIQLKVGDELETKSTIHQSIQLTEGRKTLHGRLEIKVKLREPLLAKQIEEIKEKWIVFT